MDRKRQRKNGWIYWMAMRCDAKPGSSWNLRESGSVPPNRGLVPSSQPRVFFLLLAPTPLSAELPTPLQLPSSLTTASPASNDAVNSLPTLLQHLSSRLSTCTYSISRQTSSHPYQWRPIRSIRRLSSSILPSPLLKKERGHSKTTILQRQYCSTTITLAIL